MFLLGTIMGFPGPVCTGCGFLAPFELSFVLQMKPGLPILALMGVVGCPSHHSGTASLLWGSGIALVVIGRGMSPGHK